MSFLFSQKLIEDTIRCFKEENGIDLSHEQAQEALHNMAGLFLAFSKGRGSVVDSAASRKKAEKAMPTTPLNDSLYNYLNKNKVQLNQQIRRKNELGMYVLA